MATIPGTTSSRLSVKTMPVAGSLASLLVIVNRRVIVSPAKIGSSTNSFSRTTLVTSRSAVAGALRTESPSAVAATSLVVLRY